MPISFIFACARRSASMPPGPPGDCGRFFAAFFFATGEASIDLAMNVAAGTTLHQGTRHRARPESGRDLKCTGSRWSRVPPVALSPLTTEPRNSTFLVKAVKRSADGRAHFFLAHSVARRADRARVLRHACAARRALDALRRAGVLARCGGLRTTPCQGGPAAREASKARTRGREAAGARRARVQCSAPLDPRDQGGPRPGLSTEGLGQPI